MVLRVEQTDVDKLGPSSDPIKALLKRITQLENVKNKPM